jgi:hypothetical protein
MMAENIQKNLQAEDLEGSDAKIYDALIKMGGNKKRVLDNIKSGGKFSATVGKKMKIVDEIDGFKNAFAPTKTGGRGRKKLLIQRLVLQNADFGPKRKFNNKEFCRRSKREF